MGSCVSKKREKRLSYGSYEEHSVTKHNLRMGIQFEKSPEGEVHIGIKGGLENKKDKSVHMNPLEKDKVDDTNKIPSVLDIIQNDDSKRDTTKFSRDKHQDVSQEAFAIP